MKKIIIFIATLMLAGSIFAATTTQPAPEIIVQTPDGKATLYKQTIANPGDATDKAIYIIDVHGIKNATNSLAAYKEMGRQYGYLLNKANLPAQYQNLSLESFYNDVYAKIHNSEWFLDWLFYGKGGITEISYERIPAREMALIQGAAETSGLSSATLKVGKITKTITPTDKLIFLDQMFLYTFLSHVIPVQNQAPFGCSTLATWGEYTADGKMIFARNFDWTKSLHKTDVFANRTLIGIFHPENGDNSIALVGYPGWFFSDTGVNDKGLLLEMNSGWYSSYTMNVTKQTQAYADLLSDYLYTTNNYNDLYKVVSNSVPDISYVIIGTDGNKIFAAEETADGFFKGLFAPHYVRMRTPESQSHYATDPVNESVMAVSNSFRLTDWEKLINWQITPYPYPKTDEASSYPLTRYDNLLSQARANKGKITPETIRTIMEFSLQHSDKGGATGYEQPADPLHPDLPGTEAVTYFSLVATQDTNGKLFNWWLRIPGKKNQGAGVGWVNVDLNKFFAKQSS